MIENILEKKAEIKGVWEKFRADERDWDIFHNRLNDYFNGSRKEWAFFMQWLKEWKQGERSQEIEKEVKEFSDADISELQDQNRKRAIIMLSKILEDYGKNKKSFKNIPVKEISRLYQIIQNAEEAMRRTEIATHKEKRETVRMLLPYQRMSPEDIKKLKESINVSFERILHLKSGERAG